IFPRSALKGSRLGDRPRSRTVPPGGHSHVVLRHRPAQAVLRPHNLRPGRAAGQTGPRGEHPADAPAVLRGVARSASGGGGVDRRLVLAPPPPPPPPRAPPPGARPAPRRS